MDQDLRNAALAAFKKSGLKEEPQADTDDDSVEKEGEEVVDAIEIEEGAGAAADGGSGEADEEEVVVAELAPTPPAKKATTKASGVAMGSARKSQNDRARRPGGKPDGRKDTASSRSDVASHKRTGRPAPSAGQHDREPKAGTTGSASPPSQGSSKGLAILCVLLNLILLVLVVVLFNITSGIDAKLDRQYREMTEIQQKAMGNMGEALGVIHKFSRFKTGAFIDPKKGPQSVILVLDEKGKVLKTVVMPLELEK